MLIFHHFYVNDLYKHDKRLRVDKRKVILRTKTEKCVNYSKTITITDQLH